MNHQILYIVPTMLKDSAEAYAMRSTSTAIPRPPSSGGFTDLVSVRHAHGLFNLPVERVVHNVTRSGVEIDVICSPVRLDKEREEVREAMLSFGWAIVTENADGSREFWPAARPEGSRYPTQAEYEVARDDACRAHDARLKDMESRARADFAERVRQHKEKMRDDEPEAQEQEPPAKE